MLRWSFGDTRFGITRVIGALGVVLTLSCGGPASIAIEGKDGSTCKSCAGYTGCNDSLSNADCPECEECPGIGFDKASNTVLECDGTWKAKQQCPGGGSVSCRLGSYIIRCFDTAHKVIPVKL
jgi:hypothetical protein